MKRKLTQIPFLAGEDNTAVRTAVDTLKNKTQWRKGLTAKDVRALYKLGQNSLGFVMAAKDAAETHPTEIRKKFDLSGMIQRVASHEQLSLLLADLHPLVKQLSDTLTLVGADLMQDSLDVYEDMKAAVDDEPIIEAVVRELGQRFEKSKKDKPMPPASPSI
jgi:hypothetical protein